MVINVLIVSCSTRDTSPRDFSIMTLVKALVLQHLHCKKTQNAPLSNKVSPHF